MFATCALTRRLLLLSLPCRLDEALMVMPFTFVPRLLWYLNEMLKVGTRPELTARAAVHLVKIHFKAIVSTGTLQPLLGELRTNVRGRLRGMRDVMGVNLAGLRFMQRQHENESTASFYEEMNKPKAIEGAAPGEDDEWASAWVD